MLSTIAGLLTTLWIFGFVNAWTLGGAIHLLLLLAFVMVGVDLVQRRQDEAF